MSLALVMPEPQLARPKCDVTDVRYITNFACFFDLAAEHQRGLRTYRQRRLVRDSSKSTR